MFVYLLLAFLAAFGLFSLIWTLLGFFLPLGREGWLLYPGKTGKLSFVFIYLWLRGIGLVRCPLILADLGLSDEEKQWLESKAIELYNPAGLATQLDLGVELT